MTAKMRMPLLLFLAVVSQTSAFQTAPHPPTRTTTCLRSELNNDNDPQAKELILPRKAKRCLLSKLTTFQLSALTQLKKDERNKFNKERLLKLGITMSAFMSAFKKAPIARAATPLVVTEGGAITPLIFNPGLGIVEMPGMRGISPYQAGGLPNQGAMFFALSLFVTAALLRSAGDGYGRFVHFMTKYLVSVVKSDQEDIEIGLPKETNWDQYSHSMLDPLQKKKEDKFSSLILNPHTFLFERVERATEVDSDVEVAKLEKATQFFQEQKYKQHHHPIHTSQSKYGQTGYLDTLAINEESNHDTPRGYLDTLSDAKRSTWDTYKHQLEDAKPASEVDELKQEVSELNNMMQIEQTMYQTSSQALKLAMEAQSEEWQYSSTTEELKEFDQKLSTNEELKAFDKKAQEFQDTVAKDATNMSKAEGTSKETNPSV